MDLCNEKIIQNILLKYDIRPKKSWGQNFLVSRNALNKVIAAADLSPEDTVLEIGPGIGTLTVELAKRVKRVIVVEKEQKMCEILKDVLQGFDNIEIIQGDILKIEKYKLGAGNYKIVANLPYYITSPVIRKFLEIENPPESMVLMVQKEVAQRITAKPPDMSILAVSVQFYAKPKIISYVPKSAFWPQPKVDSAIIKISKIFTRQNFAKQNLGGRVKYQKLFFTVVKAGFSHPRKQIAGNLLKALSMDRQKIEYWLRASDVKPEQRAETLSVENWISLAKNYPQG